MTHDDFHKLTGNTLDFEEQIASHDDISFMIYSIDFRYKFKGALEILVIPKLDEDRVQWMMDDDGDNDDEDEDDDDGDDENDEDMVV
mmetsp:Transcript_61705/g.69103  ORF Transcript_61705/g.69103 Transcript_61705/m.69103 type:complete len:87 (-) Transcript_61705:336-596(-)|eukprot:CAMPEP_0170870504 /NCGR_PEP_ID=MMETSP0734-20130129/25128_1 /TAXON_ID=186038 /ORGANISM="Fragilariopsis kerguelensis, Strain L26-C5" /LENGTH=86 /DNA_ID=CAMNT_0011249347 /DNA_START=696 /DNA_END=956 /DNA_ORIENTATION=-